MENEIQLEQKESKWIQNELRAKNITLYIYIKYKYFNHSLHKLFILLIFYVQSKGNNTLPAVQTNYEVRPSGTSSHRWTPCLLFPHSLYVTPLNSTPLVCDVLYRMLHVPICSLTLKFSTTHFHGECHALFQLPQTLLWIFS